MVGSIVVNDGCGWQCDVDCSCCGRWWLAVLWQMVVVVGSVIVDCGYGRQCCGRLWLMVVVSVVVNDGCGWQCCGK